MITTGISHGAAGASANKGRPSAGLAVGRFDSCRLQWLYRKGQRGKETGGSGLPSDRREKAQLANEHLPSCPSHKVAKYMTGEPVWYNQREEGG